MGVGNYYFRNVTYTSDNSTNESLIFIDIIPRLPIYFSTKQILPLKHIEIVTLTLSVLK
jgi:hypothetical protein